METTKIELEYIKELIRFADAHKQDRDSVIRKSVTELAVLVNLYSFKNFKIDEVI